MSRKPALVLLASLGLLALLLAKEVSSQSPPPLPEIRQAPVGSPVPYTPSGDALAIHPPSQPPRIIPAPQVKKTPSLWSFMMEQHEKHENRHVIRATIGKTNNITIECDNITYLTPQANLRAVGNVEVAGSNMHCTCASLTIVLSEERLVLEGNAKVTVTRNGMKYDPKLDNANSVFMDLQGERLSMRLPDLQIKHQSPEWFPMPEKDEPKKSEDNK